MVFQNNRSSYPPNIAMILDTITDIITLDVFPKDLIMEKIFGKYKEEIFPYDGTLSNAFIFLLIPFVLLFLLGIVLVLKLLSRGFPVVVKVLEKIKNFICWNMVIKTV